MKKIVDDDKRNRHDEDDDVGDPVNSSVATNDNDEDAHQHLHNKISNLILENFEVDCGGVEKPKLLV
uniref:Uncharacterized protein n=1 Tax=Oryza sativa subsp. japonica TaxID=39947 RepID=Q84YM6_ORYSJ|nr:hypothetical protein [Oryza sativa Japonica Group]